MPRTGEPGSWHQRIPLCAAHRCMAAPPSRDSVRKVTLLSDNLPFMDVAMPAARIHTGRKRQRIRKLPGMLPRLPARVDGGRERYADLVRVPSAADRAIKNEKVPAMNIRTKHARIQLSQLHFVSRSHAGVNRN